MINTSALEPVEDFLTEKFKRILTDSKKSHYMYKGFHTTRCGKTSDNLDWILPSHISAQEAQRLDIAPVDSSCPVDREAIRAARLATEGGAK